MRAASRIAIIESSVGGLLPGRAYLVHGAPGVGKTVLALQIAHAWTAVGRRVLYLTSGPPEHLLQQASLLGLSLQKDWEEERFLLCPFVAEVSEQIGALGLAAFLERLRRMDAEHDIGAIIIDPVLSLLRAYGRGAEIRRNVETLMSNLEEWEWSALLLGRTDSLQRRAGLLEALRERAWGALELSHARHGCAAGPFLLKVE
ncbi:MAG: ATPase domain-containing protein, partial [Candidatus Eisenbacteria bacterium]